MTPDLPACIKPCNIIEKYGPPLFPYSLQLKCFLVCQDTTSSGAHSNLVPYVLIGLLVDTGILLNLARSVSHFCVHHHSLSDLKCQKQQMLSVTANKGKHDIFWSNLVKCKKKVAESAGGRYQGAAPQGMFQEAEDERVAVGTSFRGKKV